MHAEVVVRAEVVVYVEVAVYAEVAVYVGWLWLSVVVATYLVVSVFPFSHWCCINTSPCDRLEPICRVI